MFYCKVAQNYLYFILYTSINKDNTKVTEFANIIGISDIVIP